MNISAVSNLLPSWAQSPVTSSSAKTSSGTSLAAMFGQPAGSAQISPEAQLMSMLQQIQQKNPDQFKQLASNIAANLQKKAQQAQSSGDTDGAAKMNNLAAEFHKSSQTGQLPPVQDLRAGLGAHNDHRFIGKLLAGVLGTAGAALG